MNCLWRAIGSAEENSAHDDDEDDEENSAHDDNDEDDENSAHDESDADDEGMKIWFVIIKGFIIY